ncbi:unnamed protein product [Onchocerca ochengi]|uniref:Pentatricopeptide repeat-containing protein n=1 Tax=Onchocerca ochengi TaxID=42157 RepID=A0A182EG60_ONCOC|nr:unnamed protein product [Onchocerca ochengi]
MVLAQCQHFFKHIRSMEIRNSTRNKKRRQAVKSSSNRNGVMVGDRSSSSSSDSNDRMDALSFKYRSDSDKVTQACLGLGVVVITSELLPPQAMIIALLRLCGTGTPSEPIGTIEHQRTAIVRIHLIVVQWY